MGCQLPSENIFYRESGPNPAASNPMFLIRSQKTSSFLCLLLSLWTLGQFALGQDASALHSKGEQSPSYAKDQGSLPSLEDTALGSLILDNHGKLPDSVARFRELLLEHGEARSVLIPFSDAPGHTDLDNTRAVLFLAKEPKTFIQLFVGSLDVRKGPSLRNIK